MTAGLLGLTLIALAVLPGLSRAGEKVANLSFQHAVAQATTSGKLDGSVKFYLAGHTPPGRVTVVNDNVTSSRKTNAFGKSIQESCDWAMQSVLIALQSSARSAGANAVIDIVSNYNNVVHRDPQNFECHKGFLMSGVALKAKLARVN